MNKTRRAKLRSLHDQLTAIKDELEEVKQEEEESLSNLPDSLQEASNGIAMQSAIDCLEGMDGELDSVLADLDQLAAGASQ